MFLLEHKDGGYLVGVRDNVNETTSDPWQAKWFETDRAATDYMDDNLDAEDWDIIQG